MLILFFFFGKTILSHFTFYAIFINERLNGRWFLQIVDIHVGNFDMKLTGRWFPQIVDRDSGNLYPICFFYAGNIEKCPFTYWLNGRWFLQIVDIGNFNMRLEIL